MSLEQPLDQLPIVVVREPGRTPLVLVLHQALEIGRDGAGLLIDDPGASRNHLMLTPGEAGVTATDLDSTNGTFLDGERIAGPTRLLPGMRLRVGTTTIELLPASMAPPRVEDSAPTSSITRIADEIAETLPRPAGLSRDATLTIVFTDIESSTSISTEMGDSVWFEHLSRHNDMMRRCVNSHGGVVIKSQGDGFMLAFESARSALVAMIEAQQEMSRMNTDLDRPLLIRVGAHTGEAISDDSGDLYGYHVNMAARIADQGDGGEILVSEIVKKIVESRGEFTFGEPRTTFLKGLSGQYVIFPVLWDG